MEGIGRVAFMALALDEVSKWSASLHGRGIYRESP
jgi:hypothetical protein